MCHRFGDRERAPPSTRRARPIDWPSMQPSACDLVASIERDAPSTRTTVYTFVRRSTVDARHRLHVRPSIHRRCTTTVYAFVRRSTVDARHRLRVRPSIHRRCAHSAAVQVIDSSSTRHRSSIDPPSIRRRSAVDRPSISRRICIDSVRKNLQKHREIDERSTGSRRRALGGGEAGGVKAGPAPLVTGVGAGSPPQGGHVRLQRNRARA